MKYLFTVSNKNLKSSILNIRGFKTAKKAKGAKEPFLLLKCSLDSIGYRLTWEASPSGDASTSDESHNHSKSTSSSNRAESRL